MRVTRWFGLFLIGMVAVSGAAAASAPAEDLNPVARTGMTPLDHVRADQPGSPSLRLADANSTQSDLVAVDEDVGTAIDEAPLPYVVMPLSAGGSAPVGYDPDQSSPPDDEQGASDEPSQSPSDGQPESAPDDGSGSLVPDVPVLRRQVPGLEPRTVPVVAAPALALPDKEEGIRPSAKPDGRVAPASATLSPSGSVQEPLSPIFAAAVAGVAVAAVVASGAAGTSVWNALLRPLSWLRRVVGLPLYARVAKDQVLDHSTRQELLDRLRAMPGACFAELHSASGVSLNTIRHHLRVLQANGVVTSVKNGRRRCFFALEHGMSAAARLQAAALSAPAPRRVFRAIERCPGIAQQELASALGVTPTSVAFHARRLLDAGVVRAERSGRALVYYPAA